MKQLKIKDKKFIVAERSDINYLRQVEFINYMNFIIEDFTEGLHFTILKNKIIKSLNEQNFYKIPVILEDAEAGLKIKNSCKAWYYCYALIVSEENEDTSKTDTIFLDKKIEIFSELGLTENDIKAEVINFTKAFPLTYLKLMSKMEGLKSI